ncbi:methyltransferase domain-containing protein [uncultured Hyphomonas sp.]|uniref:methyltransferase domain-containing protein n=1 Tax=uncultured Hyphomonas sp. TaxID=225298 RepID=UPI002AAACD02|nr:methyltransferase domain-containing protein [uncultured Hyphomonas sp.]
MTPAAPPRLFDRARVARNRDRAAPCYDDYAFLKERVSRDIADRVQDTPRKFERALDLGCHDGRLARILSGTGRVGAVDASDLSPAMVEIARAEGTQADVLDEETPDLTDRGYDLIVSALSLHWVNDLPGTLVRLRHGLKPDGLFLGALFGAGTLAELRECLMEAETEISGGVSPRLSPLPGLKDMADLMQRAGFALPVADRDTVVVRYRDPALLLADLKGMGEQSALAPGMIRPLPRAVLGRALTLYRERHADPDGRVRASFEIVHVSGWAPAPGQPKPLRPGSATASLADAVRQQGKRD